MSFIAIYLAIGLIAGFVAGLLGLGGGLILVPVPCCVYAHEGLPVSYDYHMALGISLATIVFTSVSSLRAHHGHGAVRWEAAQSILPGIVFETQAAPSPLRGYQTWSSGSSSPCS